MADNPVRFIDAFVKVIDFEKIGFQSKVLQKGGRPGYAIAIFLKLYLYGYLNGVCSSRRLEKESFKKNITQSKVEGQHCFF